MHPRIPADLIESIRAVVDCNWADELRDFKEQQMRGEDTSGHIFHDLRHLRWAVGDDTDTEETI